MAPGLRRSRLRSARSDSGDPVLVREAGFREEAFDTSPDGFMSVGAHRLAGEPAALALGRRLFTFPGGKEPGPNLTTLSP
jgi:hypothetical protein